MEEKKEEDSDQEFENNGYDPTKEAFFSDMMDMEEEIASEAYDLVEHAVNLIGSQYFDDAIEILRQAIGLYTQINRSEEIKAINDKISEVYILKEKAFREEEIEEIKAEVEEKVSEEPKIEVDLISSADKLIVEAHELANVNKFEEALDKYDEAEKILEDLNKAEDIERLYLLIEECYNKKAEFLRQVKKEELEIETEVEVVPSEDQLKEQKLEQFLEAKKREEEISTRAYEILDQAVELTKIHGYDRAIKLYSEGLSLFEELNWSYEVKRIQDTIGQIEKEKLRYFKEVEKEKTEIGQVSIIESEQEKLIEQRAKEISEQEKLAQLEKLRGLELQKMEQEFFKAQINNMVTEAARMAHDYEIAMQKAIKKGEIVEE